MSGASHDFLSHETDLCGKQGATPPLMLSSRLKNWQALDGLMGLDPDVRFLPVIPKTQTSGHAKRGLFTVADFIYDAENARQTESYKEADNAKRYHRNIRKLPSE